LVVVTSERFDEFVVSFRRFSFLEFRTFRFKFLVAFEFRFPRSVRELTGESSEFVRREGRSGFERGRVFVAWVEFG
jgi:hypothetical protein